MKEIWKPVKNFENYLCSTTGKVKSIKSNKILKGCISSRGYVEYCFSKNGIRYLVFGHRLVAETFIPNPKKKKQVNHIDGNRTNNNIENLEWVTARENVIHARDVLNTLKCGQNKKGIICLETGKIYSSGLEAEKELGIHNGFINMVCHGKKKSAHGLHFVFV